MLDVFITPVINAIEQEWEINFNVRRLSLAWQNPCDHWKVNSWTPIKDDRNLNDLLQVLRDIAIHLITMPSSSTWYIFRIMGGSLFGLLTLASIVSTGCH